MRKLFEVFKVVRFQKKNSCHGIYKRKYGKQYKKKLQHLIRCGNYLKFSKLYDSKKRIVATATIRGNMVNNIKKIATFDKN